MAKALRSIPHSILNLIAQKLSKESFQKGTTFGPQRCLTK